MAKKVNWLPNLRVDITDLEQATHGFSEELVNEHNKRILKDAYPRIVEGFRVEISDAVNREITIYSGVAISNTGRLVVNEEVQSTARSITLGGDATYYIEVQFIENEGTTDARAFWDPTFDNGLDTSGDEIPDGRESAQNVSTRITHDWEIVNPPSTTAFAVTSTPNTPKIPVAIITVSGGAITAPGSTVPARSTFARSYASGVSSIRVVNSRIFPDSFDLRLGSGTANQEDISVTANDRENGILSLAAPTANSHDVGERVLNVSIGAAQFVPSNVTYDNPIAAVAGDARIRLFQGDTEAGYSLGKDPNADTGESDDQVANLKNYVDFLSSQILEMKFGSGTRDLVGNSPPPTSWSGIMPNYYESAGSLQGARTNTSSVGNGTTTWGDFNLTNAGSAQSALQMAVDALPTTGGIIYIKSGTYDVVDTTVTCDKPVMFVGNPGSTTVRATGTAACFTFTGNADFVGFRNVDVLQNGGTANYCIEMSGEHQMYVQSCDIDGINSSGTGIVNSSFVTSLIGDASAGIGVNGWVQDTVFTKCDFNVGVAAAGSRLLNLSTAAGIAFRDCDFRGNSTQNYQISLPASSARITFDGCRFQQGSGTVVALDPTNGVETIKINNCRFETSGGVGVFDGVQDVRISGCNINVPQDAAAITFEGGATDLCVTDCFFTQASSSAMTLGVGLDLADALNVSVTSCSFIDCDYGIFMDDVDRCFITSCRIFCPTSGRGRRGITKGTLGTPGTTNWSDVSISYVAISNLDDTTANCYGIYGEYTDTTDTINDVSVSGCTIESIGTNSASTGGGIVFNETSNTGFGFERPTIIGNMIRNIEGADTIRGISVEGGSNARVNSNSVSSSAETQVSGTVVAQGIRLYNTRRATVSDNTIFSIGHSGQDLTFRGIQLQGDNTTQCANVTISGNTVIDIEAGVGSNVQGIRIEDSGTDITISGNVIRLGTNSATTTSGIEVRSGETGVNTGSLAIVGNVIRDDVNQGIAVELFANGGKVDGINISGNWVTSFDTHGIRCEGNASDHLTNVTISGNSIRSTSSTTGFLYGIAVEEATYLSIVGNTVSIINGAGTRRSIYCLRTIQAAVSANSCYISSTSGANHNIYFEDIVDGLANSNMCRITGSAGGFNMFAGTVTRCHANGNFLVHNLVGNYITGFTTGSNGEQINPGWDQAVANV